MRSEPEALDRERAELELAALLVELRAPEDVDAFAVLEVEAERVELPARHRHADRRAVRGILEREEDARPAVVPPQLGHLALNPEARQPAEPPPDALVERRDRVDGPLVVRERLDFRHRRSVLVRLSARLSSEDAVTQPENGGPKDVS